MEFAASERSTLGVEWELCLVDPVSRALVPAAPGIVEGAGDARVTGEFMQNTIELVTGVHRTVGEAVAELTALRDRVLDLATDAGAELIGAGTHPFSDWRDQVINPGERYRHVTERSGDWGRQLAIWGVHTHVGVEHREKVVPIMHGVLAHYPLILALSTSSPFWLGDDTTFSSHRSMVFQQLPTGGLPPELESWSDIERVSHDYLHTGIVDVLGEIRWDVRPAVHYGTVEIRIADGATRPDDLAAITALSHVIVERTSRRLDEGAELDRLPSWFVRENKWRASRYGLEAIVIENARGDERLVTDVLADKLEEWAPIARDLGCEREFASIERLIARGSSADRQRAVARAHGGDLTAVVDALVDELRLPAR
ncbi:glutamate--cysteine ligase [Pseudoclavibacter endophyticus]|uniref:Putative glutamate--cysteine ligase 2 n=1 Tax=Pseudoclavibacter endophyticus TaxID=1778590 RepID=A0A6H9WJQ0_9MICO|nr:glutamate--cysteine ligase [Pseudoclavibacter endophyticus]KAB1647879.1 glutamate--cysteine ligase [Pseudoclavibacter endophyticus]